MRTSLTSLANGYWEYIAYIPQLWGSLSRRIIPFPLLLYFKVGKVGHKERITLMLDWLMPTFQYDCPQGRCKDALPEATPREAASQLRDVKEPLHPKVGIRWSAWHSAGCACPDASHPTIPLLSFLKSAYTPWGVQWSEVITPSKYL